MARRNKVIGISAVVLGLLVLGAAGAWFWANRSTIVGTPSVDSYEECVAAGNPVMESYPTRCAADGKTFENPEERKYEDARQAAVEAAKAYDPGDKVCTQALVPAIHSATGASYTFPSGCIAPGWEPAN